MLKCGVKQICSYYMHLKKRSHRSKTSNNYRCFLSLTNLEALTVDDLGSRFVILVLGDPHLLECGQGRKDGASNPNTVFALRWSDDFNLNGRGSKGGDFLVQTFVNVGEHRGATGKDGVGVEVTTDIHVALLDGVVGELVDTLGFLADEGRLEQRFASSESLGADGDHLTVGELVALFDVLTGLGGGELCIKIFGGIGKLFLDVTYNFPLGGGGERVTTLSKNFHHVVREVTAGKIQTEDGVGKGITFVDWHGVGDTITGVHDNTGGTARGVQGQHGLNGDVHGRGGESLEHDLGHLFPVGLGVERGLSEKNGVLFGCNSQLVVEGVVPDLFHVIPRGNDTVLNGVFQGEDTSLRLGFVSDVGILLGHADHDTLVLRATNDRWEDGTWGIIPGESCLHHTGTIVDDERGAILIHVAW